LISFKIGGPENRRFQLHKDALKLQLNTSALNFCSSEGADVRDKNYHVVAKVEELICCTCKACVYNHVRCRHICFVMTMINYFNELFRNNTSKSNKNKGRCKRFKAGDHYNTTRSFHSSFGSMQAKPQDVT